MSRRRSLLASFGYGALITSDMAASLVSLHQVLVPPAESGGPSIYADSTAAIPERTVTTPIEERWDRYGFVIPRDPESPVTGAATVTVTPAEFGRAEHRYLTLGIQHELRRVGCFLSDPDGEWSATTRAAMKAFNDVIRVQLPTSAPNYILLTLLQGHAGNACAPSTEITAGTATVSPPPHRREATASRQMGSALP